MESVKLAPVFLDLRAHSPVFLLNRKDAPDRMVLLEQAGLIWSFSRSGTGLDASPILDLRNKVQAGGEEGLLGMAFHPTFPTPPYFYVYYTAKGSVSTISRFELANPDVASPDSETVLLTIQQPYSNHNGGHLCFGHDGMLYIGLGDGGAGGDPHKNGQNPMALLGSILRIDVNASSSGRSYAIPADNPYADGLSGAPEVFAKGLRNPWRFSVDRLTGKIWAGDVGQTTLEEVDIIAKGGNYGWNVMEGDGCFKSQSCSRDGLTLPVVAYGRDAGVSVTGGYVYRGKMNIDLVGQYIYGDFGTGTIWTIPAAGPFPATPKVLMATKLAIASFAEDADGEIYVIDHRGPIRKFVPLN